MTGSEARRENNVNLDFPRLAGQSGPVPGPMGLHQAIRRLVRLHPEHRLRCCVPRGFPGRVSVPPVLTTSLKLGTRTH